MGNLLSDEVICLAEDGASLGVAQDDPVRPAFLDHGWGHLATEVTARHLPTKGKYFTAPSFSGVKTGL